jgi:hypothetical protein
VGYYIEVATEDENSLLKVGPSSMISKVANAIRHSSLLIHGPSNQDRLVDGLFAEPDRAIIDGDSVTPTHDIAIKLSMFIDNSN